MSETEPDHDQREQTKEFAEEHSILHEHACYRVDTPKMKPGLQKIQRFPTDNSEKH